MALLAANGVTCCQWRYLPKSYPHWKTVYSCFWRWQRSGVWDKVLEALRVEVRYAQGRTATATAAIVDSQSIKSTEKGGRAAMMEPRWSQADKGAQAFCTGGYPSG